jgi:tetratricopeptide (TPR) repeat protein
MRNMHQSTDPEQAALAQAVALHNAGQSEAAMQLCQAALAQSSTQPPHAGLQQLLATLLLAQGEYAGALQAIAPVLAQHPTHAPARRVRAQAAYEQGRVMQAQQRLADARTAFLQATQAAPDLLPAWFALALVCEDLQAPADAATALRQLLRQDPQHVQAWLNLGLLEQRLGHLEEALNCHARAWQLQPALLGRITMALCSQSSGALWLHAPDLPREFKRRCAVLSVAL